MELDNIAIAPDATGSKGYNTGNIRASNGGFKEYSNFDEGIQDQQRLLSDYQTKHNLYTVKQIGNRWAPPSENNTSIYVKTLARHLGVNPDEPIDLSDPVVMGKLSYMQAKIEKGANNIPYDENHFIDLARNRHGEQSHGQSVNLDDIAVAPDSSSDVAQTVNLDDIAEAPDNSSNVAQSTPTGEASEATQEAPQQTLGQEARDVFLPTIRGLTGAAVSVANMPAEVTDAFTSAGAWAGKKLGLGDGTYTPAPRVTTGDIEQGLGLDTGTLTPQSTSEKVFAGAIPFLVGGGEAEAVQGASKAARVVNSLTRNLSASAFGSLAQHSDKDDPTGLAADLAINTVGGTLLEGVGGITKKVASRYRHLENLSNDVNHAKTLEENYYNTMDKMNRADMRYRIALNKNLPENEVNKLRNDYLDADEAHEAAKDVYQSHLANSDLYNANGANKAEYLANRVDLLRQLNKQGANLGVKDLAEQLKNPLTGEESPLLTRYNIKPNLGESVSRVFNESALGRLSEYVGLKSMDQVGKNADAAHEALTQIGDVLTDKMSNPDAIGWQSLMPVIRDLRSGQWENANATIKQLKGEMTQEKAINELGMNPEEFKDYHNALDDLNTMRKFMSSAKHNRTSRLMKNITGRIITHVGLLHATGFAGLAIPVAKMGVGKLIKKQSDIGLKEVSKALKGQYKRSILDRPMEQINNLYYDLADPIFKSGTTGDNE